MTTPPRPHLPDLGRMGAQLQRSASKMARLSVQLHSHLNELTLAAVRHDWVYTHRIASALARLSSATGDTQTQSAAEAVCFAIERSGDAERVLTAVRRCCRPLATAMESDVARAI